MSVMTLSESDLMRLQRSLLPAMALGLSKLALVTLCVAFIISAVQAQPSAQQINPNISLTLNSTTLLHSGQTVEVSSQDIFSCNLHAVHLVHTAMHTLPHPNDL